MTGDWLTTVEAARVCGCGRKQWLALAKRYGAVPRVETYEGARDGVWGSGHRYHWQAEAVLRVRVEHALHKQRLRTTNTARLRNLQNDRGTQLKARETRLETERQKILARLKERQCATAN